MTLASERTAAVAPNQGGLWLLDRLAPLSAAYNLSRAVPLVGPLDIGSLHSALGAMVQRHEVLRTRFAEADDEPVQVIATEVEFLLPVEDLSVLAREEQETQAEHLTQQEARTPFALDRGPLVRARLLRFGEHKHRLLLTLHHIIADDWSLAVFWRELSALYGACRAGAPSPLAALPTQFAEHAQLLRKRLLGDDAKRQLSYWRQALAELPVLDLPIDRARPTMPSYRGHLAGFSLGSGLTGALRNLSRAQGTTLFTTLLAALQVLLCRLSAQADIAIGIPVSGRDDPETSGLIGYFVNMLVIRGDVSGSPSFSEHLAGARARTQAAYSHQGVPFDTLVAELGLRRDPSRNPLFQVCLTKWAPESQLLQLEGLEPGAVLAIDTGTAMFDLSVTVVEQHGRCDFSIEYATDLFDASTIERMAGHFTTLLEGIVADPEVSVDKLPLLTPAERHQLLRQWNATAVAYGEDKTLAELFEAQVRRTPDALALIDGDQRLSYAQLNARANQLAHYLRTRGVGPDVAVAICMERSAHSLVGILAILKAGAAYLPLDAQYPQDRLGFMLSDADASVVLVQAATRDRFARTDPRVVCVDADQHAISRCPDSDSAALCGPANLAYIVYTSGSTGAPKGVQIPHRGACNHLLWISDRLQLSAADRVLHLTSISFDASVWEMLAPLHVGACLYLAQAGGERDMAYLARTIHEQRLSVLQVVPSMLRALLLEAQFERCRSLRYIVCGGEPLDHELAGRLRGRLPWVRLGNFYGPTEASTDATSLEVEGQVRGSGVVPIGRPIANVRCHVLDGRLQPVPIGVTGELYIGGVGLARGYVKRAELTAERFIADPFRPGERLYRTGDMVRYLPDGAIAFVGRNDDQVKIRGYRIEPGEIAAVLATHADVRACHVAARRQSIGEVGLTAYFVPDRSAGERLSPAALRSFLAARLPAHMIPASFVELESLPLMVSGKVDARALSDPAAGMARERAEYVAPSDAIERAMCRVWADVLGIERVGLDDNFFEIGGHSLLAARLFARLADELGRSPALGALFVAPTVRLLAPHYRVSATRADEPSRSLVPLRREGTRPPLYFVPGVFGNVIGYADLVRELGPDQPFYGLQATGLDGRAAPVDSIEAMAQHYIAEIRVHQPQGPYAIIGACFGATVAYEMARQIMAAGEAVAFLGLIAPTTREGDEDDERMLRAPRVVRRAGALGSLVRERFRAYLGDLQGLSLAGRLGYWVRKAQSLAATAVRPHAFKGAQRELDQLEVYRANLHALQAYLRRPLEGVLFAFEVLGTDETSLREIRSEIDWQAYWQGPIKWHVSPGRDSGDMLAGANARKVAVLLNERLHAAFKQGLTLPDTTAADGQGV